MGEGMDLQIMEEMSPLKRFHLSQLSDECALGESLLPAEVGVTKQIHLSVMPELNGP